MLAAIVGTMLTGPPQADASATLTMVPRAFPRSLDPYLANATVAGSDLVSWDHGNLVFVSPTGSLRRSYVGGGGAVQVVGSRSRLALTDLSGQLLAGPANGPLTRLDTCVIPGTLVLDGDTLAYRRDLCPGTQPTYQVRDLASAGAPIALPFTDPRNVDGPAAPRYLSVKGDYVAYTDGGDVVVKDWRSGATVFDQPTQARGDCSNGYQAAPGSTIAGFCGLAVDSDGSVWELIGSLTVRASGQNQYYTQDLLDNCTGRLDRYAPGTSTPQPVVQNRSCADALKVAGGAAVFRSHSSDEVVRPGGPSRAIGRPGPIFGFDGIHLTAEHTTCSAQQVISLAVASDPPIAADADIASYGGCVVRARSAHITLGRHPHLRVRISCPIGCVGPLVIARIGRDGGGRFVSPTASSRRFALASGGSLTVQVALRHNSKLVRQARRLLAARGRRARMSIALWALTLAENPDRPLGELAPAYGERWLLASISP